MASPRALESSALAATNASSRKFLGMMDRLQTKDEDEICIEGAARGGTPGHGREFSFAPRGARAGLAPRSQR